MKNIFESAAAKKAEVGHKHNLDNADKRYSGTCYAKRESINLPNDSMVDFMRVRHTKDTLKEFENEIRQHIENADVLISELAVNEDDDSQSDMKNFYRAITQLAKEKNKTMVVADPEKFLSEAAMNRAIDLTPVLATLGSGAYLIKKISEFNEALGRRKLNAELFPDALPTKKDDALVTRRNFLKMGIAAGIMMTGGLSTVAGFMEENKLGDKKNALLEKFLLNSLDYRNALIAKEILNLSKKHTRISVVYGTHHFMGIKKFLQNPEWLSEKMKIYEKTYGIINNESVTSYDFNKSAEL